MSIGQNIMGQQIHGVKWMRGSEQHGGEDSVHEEGCEDVPHFKMTSNGQQSTQGYAVVQLGGTEEQQ
jgi:hypothetical protein